MHLASFLIGPLVSWLVVRGRRAGPELAAEVEGSASPSTEPCGRSAARVEAGVCLDVDGFARHA